jgi:hypothetical protein
MATERQISYARSLLAQAGYDTRYMDASFKALGAKMRERSGAVEDWLRKKSVYEVSQLIESLKDDVAKAGRTK